PDLERSLGQPVKIQFGVSANLKKSIEAGEPFDLAILTPPIIEDLMKQGKIATGTNKNIARSNIGLAIRAGAAKPDVSSTDAVKRTLLNAKSIAYVKEGAAATTIVDMINRLGIASQLDKKTVFPSGADQNMAGVAEGKTE